VGCARDLVVAYRNGLVFPAGDVTALTRCLQDAFSDLGRLREWGECSRRMIDEYSYRQTTDGLVEAMRRVTGPASASQAQK
jgi:hypothetical protein